MDTDEHYTDALAARGDGSARTSLHHPAPSGTNLGQTKRHSIAAQLGEYA